MDTQLVTYILGPAGAAGLCLLLILTGWLVPRAYYRRVLSENQRLQNANQLLSEANATLRDANRNLSQSGNLTNEVMAALITLASARQPGVVIPPPSPDASRVLAPPDHGIT